MPNAWDIGDDVLYQQLGAWHTEIAGFALEWKLHLYQNDFTPVPGTSISDFVVATFPGYSNKAFQTDDFDPVTITDHVASMQLDHELVIEANATGFSSQTIYGYFITNDTEDEYKWAERFASPRVILPGDVLKITPEMRHRTYAPPS